MAGYRSRPNAGIDGLLRHLTTQDPDKLAELMQIVERMDKDSPDLSFFDLSAVPVKRAATWILQLFPIGFQTRQGAVVDDYVDGSQPVFQVVICKCESLVVFETNPDL